ncbi:MAG: malate dehydrogenase (quinone) [Flavobacteriaceae bacterium]|nr:malate dehydrogenase (quinone) [Flavobacteriaceae bacterium]
MNHSENHYDFILVGGGIMSATLAMLIHQLKPNPKIAIFEKLDDVAQESSDAWNNAGTGHSAFCELNYTPENENKSIDISKAEKIIEQFEVSKQFWAYLVAQNYISSPKDFINTCPHLSLVFGKKDIDFLKRRHQKLIQSPLFSEMEYSEDFEQLKQWMPLIMENRNSSENIAATRSLFGTDINFGVLTQKIFQYLETQSSVKIYRNYEAHRLKKIAKQWEVHFSHKKQKKIFNADFVFVGAGGKSLNLLNTSKIKETKGYGGFPVSGSWLISKNPELIKKHQAKVYSLAKVNAPPMSVPHLDLRIINGEKALLFGPFAGFSTKFLKNGSYWDFFESINMKNIPSLIGAGLNNIPLTKYLIGQVAMNKKHRIAHLREFIKNAKDEDWECLTAGQRVQIIKKDEKHGGKLEFGTEIIINEDKNLVSLLGASPGASTCVSAMIEVLEKCFEENIKNDWGEKIREMIPSYRKPLAEDLDLIQKVRNFTKEKLELKH